MSAGEVLNLKPEEPGESTPAVAEGDSRPFRWQPDGGEYLPDDSVQAPDLERLEAIRKSIRSWGGAAKERFWAREILAYGVELSNKDFPTEFEEREKFEHRLSELFARATKLQIDQETSPIAVLEKDEVNDWPVYQAISAILAADPELAADPQNLGLPVEEFIRLMLSVSWRG